VFDPATTSTEVEFGTGSLVQGRASYAPCREGDEGVKIEFEDTAKTGVPTDFGPGF